VERDGRVRSMRINDVTVATIKPILEANVRKETRLMTDTGPHYTKGKMGFPRHEMVDHSHDEYVRGDAHTNSVEGHFSLFKRGLVGTYQHMSEQHLQRYLNEFDFRASNRAALGVNDEQRAARAIKGAEGKRLTYHVVSG
jgi:ISXO2-like transposase domain